MAKILWIVSSLVLILTVTGICAEEQQSQAGTPGAINTPTQATDSNAEPNVEQLRQQARQRMRQTVMERRQQELRRMGTSGDMNATMSPMGKPVDVNAQQRQQRPADIDQRIAQAQNRYLNRLARLNRIRELAQQQNNTATIARVDKLLSDDKQIYEVKMQRMEMFKKRMTEFTKRTGPQGADANKQGNQPPVTGK